MTRPRPSRPGSPTPAAAAAPTTTSRPTRDPLDGDGRLQPSRRRLGDRRRNQRGVAADRRVLRAGRRRDRTRRGRTTPRCRNPTSSTTQPRAQRDLRAAIVYICNATAGYDGPTGLGTISGAVVAGAPGIAPPGFDDAGPNDFSYTKTVTVGSATLQGGVYPNGNDTTYFWQYGPTTAYGQTTPDHRHRLGHAPRRRHRHAQRTVPRHHLPLPACGAEPRPRQPGPVPYAVRIRLHAHYEQHGQRGRVRIRLQVRRRRIGLGWWFSGGPGGGTTTTTGGTGGGTTARTPVTHAPNAPSLGGLRIMALGSGSATVTETLNTGGASTQLLPRVRHHVEADAAHVGRVLDAVRHASPGTCAGCAPARSTTCRRSPPTAAAPGAAARSGSRPLR